MSSISKLAAFPFRFDNSYARLPERFFARLDPTPVTKPRLIKINTALAEAIGVDLSSLDENTAAAIFSGNTVPDGAEPIAMAYAGHQFGHIVPQLGDGRAILLGETLDAENKHWDIHLKGSGQTPFSRRGDGRAALGPVMREYIISDAMHALGIPTTRSLAIVTSGEPVYRQKALPGAVLTRIASSHIRIGTFQYFAMRNDSEAIKILADYSIERHYPHLQDAQHTYIALLESVIEAQAKLIARWMQVGFIHGVMNTDNMTISGETIDYGPCAFIDTYDPDTVFSSIDDYGRYAFGNQPRVAQWNLARFAECLLPLLHDHEEQAIGIAQDCLSRFPDIYEKHWLSGMRRKLGLSEPKERDSTLIHALLDLMHRERVDFTNLFRALCDKAEAIDSNVELSTMPAALAGWLERWQARLAEESLTPQQRAQSMRRVNPAYIPRNHRVEQALDAAVEEDNFSPFETLLDVVTQPFAERDEWQNYRLPPKPEERVLQTFCGT
ncbi:MAG: YdiU family protein [Methylomicrobium sp.]